MLEDRDLLATVTVTNSTDVTDYIVGSTIADLFADPGADGTISLREAIEASNNTAGANSITFDPVTSGVPIGLTQGLLEIKNGVTITGLGPAKTTVSGGGNSRIFEIATTFLDPRAVTLDGLTLTGGKGAFGGAIRSQFAFLTVSNCTIEDNHVDGGAFGANSGQGGAIEARSGVVIINSKISGNSASKRGGGIYSLGAVTIIDSTISGNSANGSGSGGGIFSTRAVTVRNSTISGNSANFSSFGDSGSGLGAGIHAGGNLTISNSTISGNSVNFAPSYGGGGGIHAGQGSIVTISSSTIFGNFANYGGGIFAESSNVTVSNSIVAGNSDTYGAPDLNYALTVTNSLIGDNGDSGLEPTLDGTPDANGNLIGTPDAPIDPLLDPLADNGGPTQTMALLTGSPALNAGDDELAVDAAGMPLPFDQRGPGFARISGSSVDMGAYEFQANQAPTDIALSPSSVAENEPAGTTIGAFSTTDSDTGDTFTYALVAGDADNASFTIDASGNLKTAASFDFEDRSSYSIHVLSSDAGGLSVEKVFTINVTDVNEAPTIGVPAAQTAYEDVDQAISGLSVGDPDGDNLSVTLQVSHGSLTLGSTASLTVSGNGSGSVTLAGSLADLNAALAGLVYRGGLHYSGGDTLAITASDGSLMSSDSVALTVQSADQQAAALQAQVNALRGSGVMNQGQANSLNVKLDLKDNAGDIGKVQSFLNQVAAHLNAGILTQAQADALTAAGRILRSSLTQR